MFVFFFFKQTTAYDVRISDWSSDVCSSDLLLGCEAALGGGRLVILAHRGDAAIQRVLRHLHDGDGDAGGQEVHGDAAAHGACADHSDLPDRAQCDILGEAVDLRGGALDRKSVVVGQCVDVRVCLGGPRIVKKKRSNQ